MSTEILLEAALRSLIMGATIWAALLLLRIRQVRAQRTAWLLALVGALAMPALVGWQVGPRLLPEGPIHTVRDAPVAKSVLAPAVLVGELHLRAQPVDAPLESRMPSAWLSTLALSRQMISSLAAAFYLCVAALLLMRLCTGLGFALTLRNRAQRVVSPFAVEADIRVSARIATPVTIASTVLLPSAYRSWDESTLRIVLTHETAHVEQRDFYIQLLAGLHCAVFWFNPFSWWLQRQLSELGEALSDRAAVEQATSRVSYAEILLAFASRGRWPAATWPAAGVAMARSSGLTPRIERLLNDSCFERSFAVKQRLPFVAGTIVLFALIASTATVRVRAASHDPASPAVPPVAALPPAAALPAVPSIPASPAVPPAPAEPAAVINAVTSDDAHSSAANPFADSILSIHSGDSLFTFDSGDKLPSLGGDYIYFQHEGKTYLIQDPGTLAKAQALLAPMHQLGMKQRELGNEQAQLGRQQAQLGREQRTLPSVPDVVVKVDTPEFKQSMAELDRVIRQMDLSHLTVQIDQKSLAQLQAHLGEMQTRIAEVEASLAVKNLKFGEQQRALGEQQGELGEQQRKLGERQRLLGEQQRKLIEDATSKLKPIIEQAIRDSMAKPVN